MPVKTWPRGVKYIEIGAEADPMALCVGETHFVVATCAGEGPSSATFFVYSKDLSVLQERIAERDRRVTFWKREDYLQIPAVYERELTEVLSQLEN